MFVHVGGNFRPSFALWAFPEHQNQLKIGCVTLNALYRLFAQNRI